MSVLNSQAQEPSLIPVASFGKSMAIGLSVNSQNRVFVSFPDYNGDGSLALAEVKSGVLHAYPNRSWNDRNMKKNSFTRVQDLYVDKNDHLWVLDSKPAGANNIFGNSQSAKVGEFKLVDINTKTNQVEKTYYFDNLDKSKSALNDVRVDVKRRLAYLSDPGLSSIVVLDLESGKTRSLLEQSTFTLADPIVLKYDGKEMKDKNGKAFSSNINSIALSPDAQYFYFKPINKKKLFKIETRYLADSNISEEELRTKVLVAGETGITHGLISDRKGSVYLSTSEDYSISYIDTQGQLKTLIRDKRILWPDSFGIGTDGYLYFSCSQLQRQAQWNDGKDETEYPFSIYKVKLP